MIESKTCEYDTAIRCAVRIFPGLASVPNAIRQTAEEIRIRSGYPIIIRTGMQNHITQITPDSEMLAECISAICQNSLHTYEKDIANGFITLYGGHRAGLCGTAVYGNGGLQTVKNFSSINIRIARQLYGAARDLLPLAVKSVLEKRVENQSTAFKDYTPDEMYKIDGNNVVTSGNYVALIICADNAKAIEDFKAMAK